MLKTTVGPGGEIEWRPGPIMHLVNGGAGVFGLAFLGWTMAGGSLSVVHWVLSFSLLLFVVIALPAALFRWRLAMERDELVLVFLRTRRLPLREIVAARSDRNSGLTFVCRDGREESTQMLSNSRWSHRRNRPTTADLVARAVLARAAELRGEPADHDHRLPPMGGARLR